VTIGRFFQHRYADVRIFLRAGLSMGGGTTEGQINGRITVLSQFRDRVRVTNTAADRRALGQAFQRLGARVKGLFFHVDRDYIEQMTFPNSLQSRVREEIIRECDQVIAYQRGLRMVNVFYWIFSSCIGRSSHSSTTPVEQYDERPNPAQNDPTDDFFSTNWFRDVFGTRNNTTNTNTRNPPESRNTSGNQRAGGNVGNAESPAVNINIPGTVPYMLNGIPQDVQQKADEIARLKLAFDNLANSPAIPPSYECPILADVMSIPVFDASHPDVQAALHDANATSNSVTTAALNNRDLRHIMDHTSFEGHMSVRNSGRTCPNCRHPIQRGNMVIDTALQDQILQFLRNAVNSA
jgi:hypothetical protein